MGYVVRHSTSNINKARRKGNVALGVSSDGYDKTSVSGFYAGVEPVEGKHNLVRTSASGDPDFYALTDTELINFANQLGGSVSNTLTAKNYLLEQDNVIFLDELPNDIVTDSLEVELNSRVEASFLNNQPTTNIYPSPDLTTYSTNGYTTVTNFGNFTEVTSAGPWYGLYQRPEVTQGKTYVYSFWYKHINGATVAGGHTDFSAQRRLDGGSWSGGNILTIPNDGNFHFIEIKFTAGSTGATSLYLQPGRGNSTTTTGHILTGNGFGVQFEEGEEATPFISSSRSQTRTWYDISGNGNDTTLVNGPTFTSNETLQFDGINDYAIIGGTNNDHAWTADGTVGSDTFTYEIWSKGTDGNGRIISKPWNGNGRYNISIYPNFFELKVGTGVSQGPDESNNITFPSIRDGKWHQFVFWANDTQMGYYKDGGQSYSSKNHGLTGGISDYGNSQLPLGLSTLYFYGGTADGWSGNTGHANEAEISIFKKYSKVLSADEVRQNYYGGDIVTDGLVLAVDAGNLVSYESGSTTAYNLTGSLYSGSLVNGTSFTSSRGGGFHFDGSNDRIDTNITSDNWEDEEFTIEAWFKYDNINGDDSWFELGRNSSDNDAWGLISVPRNGNFYFYWVNSSTNGGHNISSNEFKAGNIIHMAITFNGVGGTNQSTLYNNTKTYLNGIEVGHSSAGSAGVTNTKKMYIGSTTYTFDGDIYQYRYYNRVLSDSEILQNYNAHKAKFL